MTRTQRRNAAKAAKAAQAGPDPAAPFNIWAEIERLGPMPDGVAERIAWRDKRSALWIEHDRRRLADVRAASPSKPWLIHQLLMRGSDMGGIEPDQFEAAIDIASSFRAITARVGYKPIDFAKVGVGVGDTGSRFDRACRVYFTWALELVALYRIRPHHIVEVIENERKCEQPDSVNLLISALNLWIECAKSDAASRARRASSTAADLQGAPSCG